MLVLIIFIIRNFRVIIFRFQCGSVSLRLSVGPLPSPVALGFHLLFYFRLNEIGKSTITEKKLILMASMTSSPCFLDIYPYNWIHFHISIFLCLGTVMAITLTRLFLVFQVPYKKCSKPNLPQEKTKLKNWPQFTRNISTKPIWDNWS